MLEAVILDQLMKFLIDKGIMHDTQSAYRGMYSTETVMCSIVNDLTLHMDEGKCSIVLLLDASAAFDTVEHELLLEDLYNIGIRNSALELLKDYLKNRTFQVQIGKSFSRPKKLERGVPQGSVLGPVLFCIYTLELSLLLEKHDISFKLYADDTQLYFVLDDLKNVQDKIDRIMQDIKDWMNRKQLKLNEKKTECLVVGRECDLQMIGNV